MKTLAERRLSDRLKPARDPRGSIAARDPWAWVLALGLSPVAVEAESGESMKPAVMGPSLRHRHD